MTEKTALDNNVTHNRNDSPAGGPSDAAGASKNDPWDESGLVSIFPNSFEVRFSRDEVGLILGSKQSGDEEQGPLVIRLLSRIVMNPHTARHLAGALNTAIREFESRYGARETEGALQEPSPKRETKIHEKENELFHLVQSLNVEMGYERSFKVSKHSLCGNRFLLGTSIRALGDQTHAKIMAVSQKMGMPEKFSAVLEEKLPDANYVHFGFEENETACLYKVYLEFREKIANEIKGQSQDPGQFLLHLGFKWDVSDRRIGAVTSYTWHRMISIENIFARMSAILDPLNHGAALLSAKDIVALAAKKISHRDILYLEVSEENNPRRSFDINIYRAGLQVEEFYPYLLKIWRHYSILPADCRSQYELAKSKTFGHLSGGIDRTGKDFLTVYYGVAGTRSLESETVRPAGETIHVKPPGPAAPPRKPPAFFEVEKTDEKASAIFQLVKNLSVKIGFERSFKVFDKTLLAERFLMGFLRKSIRRRPNECVLDICRKIDMPLNFQEKFREDLSAANIVLFGFERNEKSRIYKAYLEFTDKIEASLQKNPEAPEPVVVYKSFKWDLSDASQKAETIYTCLPALNRSGIMAGVARIFQSPENAGALEIVKGIVDAAATRIAAAELYYFEAEEEDSPRLSFDINFYKANLQMAEMYPSLMEIVQYYGVSQEKFYFLYDAVKTAKFGHLAGGTDREGRSFLTVYFKG